ncbi:HNH endonuclease [Eubacteriales bacterium OttesenSCG-928-A19]|nr:HNH endonuclease [Eubacteriales bacterium OttesenSCG-928-A19]
MLGRNAPMTEPLRTLLRECIATDTMLPFYKTTAWKHLRKHVLAMDHHECTACKARGKHTRANHVHHVNHVKDRPELALSIYYEDERGKQQRQLVSLCHECHERAHGHRVKEHAPPLTPERW